MKKTFALLLAFALMIGATVAGTVAYFSDSTGTVTNTFTVGKVKAELWETENGEENGIKTWNKQYHMIPGTTQKKNPVVEVSADSEDCYLFIKAVENDTQNWVNFISALTKENGWTQGLGTDGIPTNVWYRLVAKNDKTKQWHLIENDQVTINSELGKDEMPTTDADYPTLTYTAYVIQKAGFDSDIKGAWEEVSKTVATNP